MNLYLWASTLVCVRKIMIGVDDTGGTLAQLDCYHHGILVLKPTLYLRLLKYHVGDYNNYIASFNLLLLKYKNNLHTLTITLLSSSSSGIRSPEYCSHCCLMEEAMAAENDEEGSSRSSQRISANCSGVIIVSASCEHIFETDRKIEL